MPEVACRDGSGLDCDWFFKHDDMRQLMLADVKHLVEAHGEPLSQLFKKVPVSHFVAAGIPLIKGQVQEHSTFACSDLGTACEYRTEAEAFLPVLVQALQHWEETHKQEWQDALAKKNYSAAVPCINAIKK
jgi:predicted small metal-binding protein